MAVTHFVTQFTHVSRYFGIYNRKQDKTILRKTFLNLKKKKNYENIYNLCQILGTKLVLSIDFCNQFQKQFFLNFFFVFYSKLSNVIGQPMLISESITNTYKHYKQMIMEYFKENLPVFHLQTIAHKMPWCQNTDRGRKTKYLEQFHDVLESKGKKVCVT